MLPASWKAKTLPGRVAAFTGTSPFCAMHGPRQPSRPARAGRRASTEPPTVIEFIAGPGSPAEFAERRKTRGVGFPGGPGKLQCASYRNTRFCGTTMGVTASQGSESGPVKRNAFPFYAPRIWHGLRVRDWWRLVCRNRFRIHPLRIPMAFAVSSCAVFNSTMARVQWLAFRRKIEQARLTQPPLFIVGHWRSGTTYLHELMSVDERFTTPSTFECFAPEHFLVTSPSLPWLLNLLLPQKRPMDDMPMGTDRPQEDEFALVVMGAPSPMRRLAFPNHDPSPYLDMLDMEYLSAQDLAKWQNSLQYFLKALTLKRSGQRFVLKSPPHTGRIGYLARMFPGAQFIHLTRNPFSLFASTMRLWKTLDYDQGFQIPRHEHLEEFVFAACERMYQGFEKQRRQIPAESIIDVQYESLVDDPIGELRRVYETLHLGDFEPVRARLEADIRERREYQAGRYELPHDLEERIRARWQFYFENYGYDQPARSSSAAAPLAD
jgi:omega-hydroxy-beta-dihydromenaquinone-9 sulfotransferase